MRISDWRSDVCSSDLDLQVAPARQLSCLPKIGGARRHEKGIHVVEPVLDGPEAGAIAATLADIEGRLAVIALLRIGGAKIRNMVEPALLGAATDVEVHALDCFVDADRILAAFENVGYGLDLLAALTAFARLVRLAPAHRSEEHTS